MGFGDNIVNEDDIIINIKKLDSFDFENISLMKIDVENMEIEVLEGAINLINKCKPVIIIETYQYDNFINSDIFKALQTIGYNIHIIPEGHNDFIMKIDE